jgi:SAM-dependent methyltransferase
MSTSDPWLQRWLSLVRERAGSLPVLELGCGTGEDTATLLGAGHPVIAIDLSQLSITEAKAKVPAAEYHCQDIRSPFPTGATQLGVVVASLSLHYFTWLETLALVERIRDTLRPSGVLLCRLNSTNDHNYGASGHVRIAENYFSVHGEPKRFFDRPSIQALFAKGWSTLAADELVTHKYAHPKSVWEVVLERAA